MDDKGSLKHKTMSGMFWSFFDLVAKQGINMVIQIILARLLLPRDFGIIGMIVVFISISQVIINSGFNQGLIREKEVNQDEYSTIFFFNVITAIAMYMVLFISSETISGFFNEPLLELVLKVLGIGLIFDSIGIIQLTILTRRVDFKAQSIISIVSSLISGAIGIAMAYMGYGVWSLVARTLVMQFVQTFLLCMIIKWRPIFTFKKDYFKRIFGFSWKLTASGLIEAIYSNMYYLIIGKMFSATDLGYYANGRKLVDTVNQSFTMATDRVSYPVLSSIKEDSLKLRLGYRKIIKNSCFVIFPLMIGMAATADSLIPVLFGSKWIPSIIYFQILCFSAMLYPVHAFNLNILKVKGRSDLFLGLDIFKKIIGLSFIGIILIFQLGILALLWIAVFNSYLMFFINSHYTIKLLSYSRKNQLLDMLPSFAASIAMGAIVYGCGLVLTFEPAVELLCQTAMGISSYIIISKVAGIEELNTINDFIKMMGYKLSHSGESLKK